MPLIPGFGRQRQADLCEFEASLSTGIVPGQPGLHRETLSQKNRNRNKTKKKSHVISKRMHIDYGE